MKNRVIVLALTMVLLMGTSSIFSIFNASCMAEYPSLSATHEPDKAFSASSSTAMGSQSTVGSESANLSEAAKHHADKWNMNDTSVWGKLAYSDGNKTRLIVGLNCERPTVLAEISNVAVDYQAGIVNTVEMGGRVKAVVVELSLVSVSAFVERIRAIGLATYVEPNMKVHTQLVPNDTYWGQQWGPEKIEADWAWNTTVGSHDILVAVVDTGIDYTHPDLAANCVSLGYDWVNMDTDPMDDFGHGTHCAGIIAAVLNNGLGIAGLAQAHVMAEKVLDSYGYGYWDWVANGIIHATDQGADVISMSLGGYGDSELVHDAVKYAYDAGVLIVAAAGNDGSSTKSYPAAYDEVIAVAATDPYDNTAWFSNSGEWIELAAPGVDVYSTMPTYHVTLNDYGYAMNYDYLSGTSMACPHVSGLAALLLSQYPSKSRDWARLWLRNTSDDLGDSGFDVNYGWGRINAKRAIEQVPPSHELIAYSLTTPPYVEPNSTGIISATVLNFGENDEMDLVINLYANDTVVASTVIPYLASGNSTLVALTWNAMIKGLYNVTLYIVPALGETNLANNVLSNYVFVGHPVKAVVLHSYGNIDESSITNWQALNNEWYQFGEKMVYIDYATLNKDAISYDDIAATKADVLIISCAFDPYAGWEFTDSEVAAIEQYVHEGHGLIATAGTLYYSAPNNNKLAPLFGLNETIEWSATYTDLLHLLNATHPFFTNVPNPLVFPDIATNLPYDGRWSQNELQGGKYLALGHFQESAIVTFRGLVFISPWLEIVPPYYHHHLQLLYNAIVYSKYQKPQHDLVASLQCPNHLKPGDSVVVNAIVANMGLNNETNVNLSLRINDVEMGSLTVPKLGVGESANLSYLWRPIKGAYTVSVCALPVPGETDTYNNIRSQRVVVTYPAVIGFIETHGESLHSDDLKTYYRNMGHTVVSIYSQLASEMLNDFDILIVGEDWYGNSWMPSEISAVKDFIDSGRSLVAIGDELTYPVQQIFSEYGISYTGQWPYNGPSGNLNRSHPIMSGVGRIYAPDPVNSLRIRSPGCWLASDSSNTYTLIACAESSGHVVFMSDDFAMSVYNEDNEVMFANLVAWMTVSRDHDIAVSLESSSFLEPSTSILLNATVQNRGSNNETGVELHLLINGSVVQSETVAELLVDEYHTISYLWAPPAKGTYNVTAYSPPVQNESLLTNNRVSRLTIVTDPLIHPIEGQYANYKLSIIPPSGNATTGYWNFTYGRYISPFQINVTIQAFIPGGGSQSGWMIVNIFTRIVETDSGIYWRDMWYPGMIETNVTIGSPVGLLSTMASISGSRLILACGHFIDCWEIRLNMGSNAYMFLWYDKASGLWVAMGSPNNATAELILLETNIPLGSQDEHDLTVKLESPLALVLGRSTVINATVYNTGLYNETDVTLRLIIDGGVVNSTIIPELHVGTLAKIAFVWTPLSEGTYNVTAYSLPVAGETNIANNVETAVAYVSKVEIPQLSCNRPSIYVNPQIVQAQIGETFTISVNIFNLTNAYVPDPENPLRGVPIGNLYGFDVQFTWNPAVLKYVSHTVTAPVETYPGGVLHAPPELLQLRNLINESGSIPDADPRARAWFAYAAFLPADPFNNLGQSNTVFYMTFKVVGTGMSQLEIVGATLADKWGDPILHDAVNGLVLAVGPTAHDVSVASVACNPNVTCAGGIVGITVVAANVGGFAETFDVTTHANATVVDFRTVSVALGENVTFTCYWNTTGMNVGDTVLVWAEASHVPSETILDNNICYDGIVRIKMRGDLNGNGVIDIYDIVLAAVAYASRPGDPNWNPEADLMKPFGLIDICDIVMLASMYGRTS